MSLEYCTGCGDHFLTESDPYVVFPHYTGYHLFCLDCGRTRMYLDLLQCIDIKTKELAE